MESRRIFLVVLFLCFSVFMFLGFSSAEDLTITTYYPSPYGSYNQLSTNSLLLNPQSSIPINPGEGTTYYDSMNHFVKYWNGTEWIQLGSSNQVIGTFTKSGDLTLADLGSGNWQNITAWNASGAYASVSNASVGNLNVALNSFGRGLYLIEWSGNVYVRDLTAANAEWVQCRLISLGPGGSWYTLDSSENFVDEAGTGVDNSLERAATLYLTTRNWQQFRLQARKSHGPSTKVVGRIRNGFYLKVTRLTSL